MFLCNTSAIKDWSYFLSQILPLMNRTAGLVSPERTEPPVTAATVLTALQPDSAGAAGLSAASQPPLNSVEPVLQYAYSESDLLYTDNNRTPTRGDAVPLPRALLYLLLAALLLVAVAYGIVGHLLKDLINDYVGGGRSMVAEGDGGDSGEPDWVFVPGRAKPGVSCVASTVPELCDAGAPPRLLELGLLSLSPAPCLSPRRAPQDALLTVDETPEPRSGT